MSPRVSVIMAAHNAGRFVGEAVQSILEQTIPDWELIIVDDASTDDTPEVLQRFDDSRITILRNEQNSGPAVSRNRALDAARGEYIAILDADDVALPQRLERQVVFLVAHPEFSGVGAWAEKIDETGRCLELMKTPTHPAQIEFMLTHTSPTMHSSATVRVEALKSVGGYDPAYPCSQDYDLWVRLALQGHRFACLPEVLIRYRSSAGQISTARRTEQARFAEKAAERYLQCKLGWTPDADSMSAYRAILVGQPALPGNLSVDKGLTTLRKVVRDSCCRLSKEDRTAVQAYVRACALAVASRSKAVAPDIASRIARAMMEPLMGGLLDRKAWRLLAIAALYRSLQLVLGRAAVGTK